MSQMIEFINRIIYDLTQTHPLHPMIVHFPIGLTGAALFFVLLAIWRRSDLLEKVAFANISLAAVSTIVAALAGMRDNINLYSGLAPNAIVKVMLAAALFIVTVVIAVVRWRKPDLFHSPLRALYIAGYFISFFISATLGFLGGVILYGF
jgi:uncharacterized membrane protein